MTINDYFDKVYLLNLNRRDDRLKTSTKKMQYCDIEFERFGATDGSVMKKIWESFSKDNKYFKNPNYVGCAISHLSIYRDAIEKGYKRILIVEDDNCILKNANVEFSKIVPQIPKWELLYLGFIPLSDDGSIWDYNVFEKMSNNIGKAKNFWGLYGYGITSDLMKEVLNTYNMEFPMELDRYFVKHIQPRGKSFSIVPQIFAASDDEFSDNSGTIETGMLQRSVDTRIGKLTDYI